MLLLLGMFFCTFVLYGEGHHVGKNVKTFALNPQCTEADNPTNIIEKSIAKRSTKDMPPLNSQSTVTMPSDCNRVLAENSGQVTSPNWPRKKVDYLQCRVTILLEHPLRPLLTFDQFELEGNKPCANEKTYVLILDIVTGRHEKICGTKSNFTFTPDSNEVVIDFVAYSSTVFHRFRATYEAINRQPSTECSATLASKSGRYTSLPVDQLIGLAIDLPRVLCQVLFHAPAEDRVLLTFATLTSPCATPVMIKDVLTAREAEICGGMTHFSWVSDGNEVLMTYSQDKDFPALLEIILEYASIEPPPAASRDCSGMISPVDGKGQIFSPLYPYSYPNNLDCETFITIDPTLVLELTFDVFMLEDAIRVDGEMRQDFGALPVLQPIVEDYMQQVECVYDYVQIKDMTTDRVDRICGVRHPFSWTSDSNEIVILFHTDDVLSFTGYTARFLTKERPPDGPACMSLMANTGAASFIVSALYPLAYPSNQDCSLLIHQDPDQFLTLDFLNFDLEKSEGCENDVFRVLDITTRRTESFCGRLPSFSWSSDSNEVLITFKTDALIQTMGFTVVGAATILPSRALIGPDCRRFLVETSGEIKLPPNTEWPPLGGSDCFILIHTTALNRIFLHITEFSIGDMENYPRPAKDFVAIQDISPRKGGRSNFYYGHQQTPFLWTSERNEVIVYASQSTAFLASVRLTANYRTFQHMGLDCSFSYAVPTGDINWSLLPALLDPKEVTYCDFLIHADPDKQIVLKFEELILNGIGCQDHNLKVSDFGSGKSDQFCASQGAFTRVSEYNELYIELHHSGSNVLFSIQASYYFIDRPRDSEIHKFLSEPSGSFSSLQHLRRADVSLANCSETIQVPAGQAVLIRFFDFLVGDQPANTMPEEPVYLHPKFSCQQEFVELLDITTGRRDTYCGKFSVFSWTSDNNAVRVTYAINFAAMYHGFRATYLTIIKLEDTSSQFLSNKLDSLQSASFPSDYPAATIQSWIIHAEPSDMVTLRFTTFALEPSPDCQKDYIELHDLTTDHKTKLCGTYGLFVWTSEGNEMKLTLFSDETITHTGIDVIYELVPKPTATTCQFHSFEENGSLKPEDLLKDEQIWYGFCQFVLRLPPDQRIRLTVDELHTSDNCTNSSLNVVDDGSLRRKDFCNVSHPFSWTSDTNEVILGLVAYQDQIPQFSIRWQGIQRMQVPECAEVYDDPPGLWTVQSNNFATLANNKRCQILFTVEPHQRVLLSLIGSEVPQITNCDDNYIQLEDSTTQRLDRYCNTESGFSWAADGNEVLVTVVCSEDVSFSKWLFNFTVMDRPQSAQDCSKVLTNTEGIFESLNYPLGYLSNLECHTLLHTDPDKIITLVFTDFRLEPFSIDGCLHDYVEIHDLTSNRIEGTCGYQYPFSWTSDSNAVMVKFISDNFLEAPGFAATYSVSPEVRSKPDCNVLFYGESGIIETPSRHTQEELAQGISLVCHYTIHGTANQKILLSFDTLILAVDTMCTLDKIKVSDGTTGRMDTYCEPRSTFTWESDRNEVKITFITDDISRDSAHFSISYKMLDAAQRSVCDATLSDAEGGIESPNYPVMYDNNLNCTITIVGEEGQLIEIDFATLDLEYSEDCSYDFIELSTVGSGDLERYCGTHSPFTWMSTGNVVNIHISTDHIINKPGFQGVYTLVDKLEITRDCDESLTTSSGMFSSPGYPMHYPNNRDCRYLITANVEGQAILITFKDFELEYHQNCDYDYVMITDELTGLNEKLCGSRAPFSWKSRGKQVLVELHSDSSAVYRGFEAQYVTVKAQKLTDSTEGFTTSAPECMEVLTSKMGFFSSPNFPGKYPNKEHCQTVIATEPQTRVRITFPFLDVEEHIGCDRDSVQIEDKVSGRKSKLLCGKLDQPFVWESDSNHIVVNFRSDNMLTRSGYYGTYETI